MKIALDSLKNMKVIFFKIHMMMLNQLEFQQIYSAYEKYVTK
jgi:hypothetical protein